MVVFSNLSIGEMMAVFGYLWFMMGPVQEILAIQYAYSAGSGALQRINNVLDLEQEPKYPQKQNPFDADTVSVDVKNLFFHYPGKDEAVLHDLSFTIQPGENWPLSAPVAAAKPPWCSCCSGFISRTPGKCCITVCRLKILARPACGKMWRPSCSNRSCFSKAFVSI